MELQQLSTRVQQLAEQAGRAILDVYNRPAQPEVMLKRDESPLTEADLAAHRLLMQALPELLDVPVLSEESALPDFAVRSGWRRYWLVDPLDGTREFVSRNGEFTVNVALIESGRPILGVVHVPVTGSTYSGAVGLGARKSDSAGARPIAVRRAPLAEPLVVVASRRHGAAAVAKLLAGLRRQTGDVVTRQIGSSLKFCLLAEGEADLYPRLTATREWDTAAGQAVLEAAGGAVLDQQWRPLRYNRQDSLLNPSFYALGDVDFDWRGLLFDG